MNDRRHFGLHVTERERERERERETEKHFGLILHRIVTDKKERKK
jgi:hypothetical protein